MLLELIELLRSIEDSSEVEARLFQWESKWEAVWNKVFSDLGVTDIAIPLLPKEQLRKSIIGDVFKERLRSMGIFNLVEAMVNNVISVVQHVLTLPEAQPFLKSIQREERVRIDEANKISAPARSLILKVGVADLDDSQHIAELWRPLKEVAFRRVQPPFEPLRTEWEWANSFYKQFLEEVAEKFIRERVKLIRESDEGRAFSLGRSYRGLEAAIEVHIDHEARLRRRAKEPIDRIIYALRTEGWRSKELVTEVDLLGYKMSDEQIRQRYSRLSKQMRDDKEKRGE